MAKCVKETVTKKIVEGSFLTERSLARVKVSEDRSDLVVIDIRDQYCMADDLREIAREFEAMADVLNGGSKEKDSEGFRVGDIVKQKNGQPFSNGCYILTVSKIGGVYGNEQIWFKETNTHLRADRLELVSRG